MRIWSNNPSQFPGLEAHVRQLTVAGSVHRGGEDRQALPDRDFFISRCNGPGPLCINIEAWRWDIRTHSHAHVDESIRKLMTVTRLAQEAFPGRSIGHYGIFPIRDYWATVGYRPDRIIAWNRANGYLKKSRLKDGRYNAIGLADLCHVAYPSLYTFYNRPAEWVTYAQANIRKARSYQKPIVPFLWPRYHNSNEDLSLEPIEGNYWRLQLDTLKDNGIEDCVIWDEADYFHRTEDAELWTPQTPWIQATLEFIGRVE